MSDVVIRHISVALDINFNSVESFSDKACSKFKSQGAWTLLRGEFCFLRQSKIQITKYFETNSRN